MNWFRRRWRVVESSSGFFHVQTREWYGQWRYVVLEDTLDRAIERMQKLANPVRGYVNAEGNVVRTNYCQDRAQ